VKIIYELIAVTKYTRKDLKNDGKRNLRRAMGLTENNDFNEIQNSVPNSLIFENINRSE
jgi:hypothetical protein